MEIKNKVHRSRLEILFNILECIDAGMGKTHIMYEVFMSGSQIKRYIKEMTNLGLMTTSINGRNVTYSLTPKGIKVLNMSRELIQLLLSDKPRNKPKRVMSKIFGW